MSRREVRELHYFDVVILPPPRVRDHAIALSAQLAAFGGGFVLGLQEYLPHVSLYHIPIRRDDFPAFAADVRDVAAACQGGELTLSAIDMPVLATDRPAWLRRLHGGIVRRTCRYVDWDSEPDSLWKTDYLPAGLQARAQANLRQYGSPLIGSVFSPHITLTSFDGNVRVADIPLPGFEPLTFTVEAISICTLGPSHSCQKLLASYALGTSKRL